MKTLKRFIAIITLVASTLFMTSSIEAQSCRIVTRGGQRVIILNYSTQYRTPNHHRARPHRYHNSHRRYTARRRYYVPRRFIYQRHVDRFYYDSRHTRSRCSFCRGYDRWKNFRRTRRGYDPVIHVYRSK